MESHMHEAFSDEILAALAGRYRVKIEDLQSLGGFENFVYTFGDGDHSRVLRISHGGHRSADQLQAEVDWVVDLFKNDIPVSQPLPSLNDRLVESLRTTAGEFHAVCFAKAAGGPAKPEDWNDQLFHTLGKIMGKMHKLTRTYEPKASAVRHDWEAVLRQDLQTSEAWLSDKFKALLDYFSALPQDRDRYGLIHDDIHRGNFFVTDDSLTLFDFDDCKYSWFAEDIAVALFYAIPPDGEETKRCETAQIFYESFLNGYETVLSAPAGLGEWLPYFLKLRELQVYAAIQKSGLDENKLTGWAGSFMKERKPKLVNDVPYLNGDQWF